MLSFSGVSGCSLSFSRWSSAACSHPFSHDALPRYLESGQGKTQIDFVIPMNGCGTALSEPDPTSILQTDEAQMKTGFSNIIIAQMDEEVQEVWDSARKINCQWTNLIRKRVEFEPFAVQMLDFEEVQFEGDSVDCWMDLQVGKYPDSEEVHSAVKIGEPLSMLVFAKDNENMYDMHIKECFAYSSENYDNSDTVQLQLTDEQGCVMKNKLLEGFFTKRVPNEDGGENIVAYGYLSAFKFPDVLDVYTTCEVEICKGGCRNKCPDEPIEEGDETLGQPNSDDETTTEPYFEGSEIFGPELNCDNEGAVGTGDGVDSRCRKPKLIDSTCDNNPFDESCPPDCELYGKEDERCAPDCDIDPFNKDCPPDCQRISEDPRCPLDCNLDPMNKRCPPDCQQFTGKDERCPCSDKPTHLNCPADCKRFRREDPRCPPDCLVDPFNVLCPTDCSRFAGKDPRCPCSKNPLSKHCPPDCARFGDEDPRCAPDCERDPFQRRCPPDCEQNTGLDPRCPCSKRITHPNCPPDCQRNRAVDPRCPPDCIADPLNVRCPADCKKFAGKDPRCPCSKFPLNVNCPPDCDRFRGKDPRCPCSEEPFHKNCPEDCTKNAGLDPRCPCSHLPTHPNCPPDCEQFTGQDPRCPCDKKPFHRNCPAQCHLNAGKDPRCPCTKHPLHSNCLDCDKFRGKDPRCPCEEDPQHRNCPPDCDKYAGQDERCPCSKYPLSPNCPPNCDLYAGRDPRCPCSKYPFNENCPQNCKIFAGQDLRCPCEQHPFNLNCPANCEKYIGKDPRCPCARDPFNPKCPANCKRFRGRDPRCPPDCKKDPFNKQCPPNCKKFQGQDPRCVNPCDENPEDPSCEGSESLGQPQFPDPTTTQRARGGRERDEGAVAEPSPDGGHRVPHRNHPFHSFHYDKGDGRRGRNGVKKRVGRSIDFDEQARSLGKKNLTGRARLARHITVISADDLPHFDGASLDFQHFKGHIHGAICLTPASFFSGLTTLLVALFLAVTLSTVQWLRERRRSKQLPPSKTAEDYTYEYQTPCDEARLSPLYYVK